VPNGPRVRSLQPKQAVVQTVKPRAQRAARPQPATQAVRRPNRETACPTGRASEARKPSSVGRRTRGAMPTRF